MLFRKISNFTPVATAQGNALEKLLQLGIPRLIFQKKILLTEILVGSSSLIPEPACTSVHPGKQKTKFQRFIYTTGYNYLNCPCKMPPQGKGKLNFSRQSSLSSLRSAKGRDCKNKDITNIFKRPWRSFKFISMNILHHPSGFPRTNTN